jgi:hypothetical protein
MAGQSAERQETAFVNKIKEAVKKNEKNPITVIAGKTVIEGVVDAEKYKGRQASGSEPYTDVVLFVRVKDKIQEINCSLKGESAPSLAGGGLRGLELAVPGLAKKFMKTAYKVLSEKKKLKIGDKVPDTYGKIANKDKLEIVVGNERMGGPIHFMYIGPMNVVATYDYKENVLKLNGALIAADEYAKTHDLYFRLRARREDQRFDPSAKDKDGTPKIYGKSPSKGDSAGRIVVTDSVPSTALILRLT